MNIERINQLAKKSREEGLTEAEKAEQKELRSIYIQNFRASFQSQLDNTYIVTPDGEKTKLSKKN